MTDAVSAQTGQATFVALMSDKIEGQCVLMTFRAIASIFYAMAELGFWCGESPRRA